MNDEDEMASIIHRMMRDLDEDAVEPNRKPRCDGCGKRLPLQPYVRATSDGGSETLMYCEDCRRIAQSVQSLSRTNSGRKASRNRD
jgi:predicted  nucleic acid-binding Zn-ribbon protein